MLTEISSMNERFSGHYAAAARLINEADSLIIAAGAGMGVDSGLPDFRGKKGFWTTYSAPFAREKYIAPSLPVVVPVAPVVRFQYRPTSVLPSHSSALP